MSDQIPELLSRVHARQREYEIVVELYRGTNVRASPKKIDFERLVSGTNPEEQIPALEKRFNTLMSVLNQ